MNIVLCALFMALQITDGVMTTYGVNHGIVESNPIMAPLAPHWWFVLVKIAIFVPSLAAVYLIVVVLRRKRPQAERVRARVIKAANISLACCSLLYVGIVINNVCYLI